MCTFFLGCSNNKHCTSLVIPIYISTGWVYQPRPGKRKRFPLSVSTVFSGTTQNIIATSPMVTSAVFTGSSQNIITTNPTTIYPFRSSTYSVVIPSVQNSIGHPVCEFIRVVYVSSLNDKTKRTPNLYACWGHHHVRTFKPSTHMPVTILLWYPIFILFQNLMLCYSMQNSLVFNHLQNNMWSLLLLVIDLSSFLDRGREKDGSFNSFLFLHFLTPAPPCKSIIKAIVSDRLAFQSSLCSLFPQSKHCVKAMEMVFSSLLLFPNAFRFRTASFPPPEPSFEPGDRVSEILLFPTTLVGKEGHCTSLSPGQMDLVSAGRSRG